MAGIGGELERWKGGKASPTRQLKLRKHERMSKNLLQDVDICDWSRCWGNCQCQFNDLHARGPSCASGQRKASFRCTRRGSIFEYEARGPFSLRKP